jgi:hypothetical protein
MDLHSSVHLECQKFLNAPTRSEMMRGPRNYARIDSHRRNVNRVPTALPL